jgi:hypothetical protein
MHNDKEEDNITINGLQTCCKKSLILGASLVK